MVVVVGTAIALTFVPVSTITVTVPVTFRVALPDPVEAGRPDYGFDVRYTPGTSARRARSVDGSVKIAATSKWFVAANAFALFVVIALVRCALDQFRAVLGSLVEETPFVAQNAIRIRWLGALVIGGEFVRSAIVFAENAYATTHVAVAGVTFDAWPRLHLLTVVYGLLILVIAEVFRTGTRLDEERSLTI